MAKKLKFTGDGLYTTANTLFGEVLIKMSVTYDIDGNRQYIWIAYGPTSERDGDRFNSERAAKIHLNKMYGELAA